MDEEFVRKTILERMNCGLFTKQQYIVRRYECDLMLKDLGLRKLDDTEMVDNKE